MSERCRGKTDSICPVCMKRIPAVYIQRDGEVVMQKECPNHGRFQTTIWKGSSQDFSGWQESSAAGGDDLKDINACTMNCDGCRSHLSPACCVVLEVTQRCNMRCHFCLAASGGDKQETLSFADLTAAVDDLYSKGIRYLHLGGGEPTVREDLIDLISYISGKGFEYIQLNTNGLRLAEEPGYTKRLAEAGLSSVFLQFDGTSDEVWRKIRGRALCEIKEKAIEACDEAYLGVILVPALIPGINDLEIGKIIRFGLTHMPAVKGIHFQPVTYMGRVPFRPDAVQFTPDSVTDTDLFMPHMTIPEVLSAIEEQTEGLMKASDLYPSVADHPLCGFHGEFRFENGTLQSLARPDSGCCCGAGTICSEDAEESCSEITEECQCESEEERCCEEEEAAVERSRRHVRTRWTRKRPETDTADLSEGSLDRLLQELYDSSFSISGMAFQDAATLDVKRLMQCTLRIWHNGILMPFCMYHTVFSKQETDGKNP